jgi:DNA repair protein RecN (Recombination protein N)
VKGHSKLLSIQIKNLGVIESATVNLSDGLTVLTGETGAGKTMVLTALQLILGGKADQRLVRNGSDRLVIAAEFDVDKSIENIVNDLGGTVEDGTLLITRIVNADGKSKATLGGAPVPAATLATIGEELIEIHAQSSSLRLAKESVQRELIDLYSNCGDLLSAYQAQLDKFKEAKSRLGELEKSLKNRDAEIARLKELVDISKKFELSENIYDEINNEISRLEGVEDLNRAVSTALEILNSEDSNLASGLRNAAKSLQTGKSLDKELAILSDEFQDGLRTIESVLSDLERYKDTLNADPARFDYLQSRKAELNGVLKRYGSGEEKNQSLNLIVSEAKSAKAQIEDLSGGEDRLIQLSKEVAVELKSAIELAEKLSASRLKGGAIASKEITKELTELALAGAVVEIEINSPSEISEKDLGNFGVDTVQFMFSSHKSAKLAPLSKSASGGELSRVMLAIEVVLSKSSSIGTFIFDEVDAGVGGKAAVEVGRKLASVSKTAQVVVVTHLPQVAVWANNHLMVEKSDKGDVIESSVFPVTAEARATEIARLLSGQESSESAREHARELLELVGNSALR